MDELVKQKVNFKVSGTELNVEDGYDLYYLSESMTLFNQLIEKTYLSLKDEKQMSKEKREDLRIKVFDIRPGSFEADFIISVSGVVPSLLTMVTPLTAKNIWGLAKDSFKYLKAVLEANKKGEKLHMSVKESENVQIINGSNNIIYTVHPDVIRTANETYPVYKKLSNLVDEKDKTLEKVVFKDELEESEPIVIGVEEKMLLQNNNVIEENPIEFKGRIYNADADRLSGKLTVLESEDISLGDYSFEFLDRKNSKMKKYYDETCEFSALKYTSFNPHTLEKTIIKLKVISANKVVEDS